MSGVYIKGMEMPTTGLYFVSVDNTNGRDKSVAAFERMLGNRDVRQIVGSFELIPVPEHGDLIDRDKLEKDIDKYIGGEESRSRFHHWVQVQDAVIPMDKGEEK